MKRYLALCFIALATGCTSFVNPAPGAEKVRIVKPWFKETVSGCKVVTPATVDVRSNEYNIGAISADNETILRNYTFAVGGDTFFPTHGIKKSRSTPSKVVGIVYNCTGVDTRQPVPMQSK